MTHTIPDGTQKRVQAEAFGRELRKAMTARRVGSRWLAAQIGLGRTSICHYLEGDVLPKLDQARTLSEALRSPKLLAIVREARTFACEVCGAAFVNDSPGAKRYCSPACRGTMARRRTRRTTIHRADHAERERTLAVLQVAEYAAAVEAFCRTCEPDGHCVAPECELRPVSPLPLVDDDARPLVVLPAPGPYGNERNRTKTVAAIRKALAARWTPEARDAWRQRMIARHAERSEKEVAGVPGVGLHG